MVFPWRRPKEKKEKVFEIIENDSKYLVDINSLELFFEAVRKYPLPEQETVNIRNKWLSTYRSYSMLIDSLQLANMQILEKERLLNDFNRGYTEVRTLLDSWLIDENSRRIPYKEFIDALCTEIEGHLDRMSTLQLIVSKPRFEGTVTGLYTVYYDCLNIAEMHLRQFRSINSN